MDEALVNLEKSFSAQMNVFLPALKGQKKIAIAVSGGPDSMALCYLLSRWAQENAPHLQIHAITVDHCLRAESAQEAQSVGVFLAGLKNVAHHILTWSHTEKPESRVQEQAREARYALIFNFMQQEGISYLFLGHHQDDQAETILFRLAKGSGLDGLGGMEPRQETEQGFTLCRPLLGFSKAELVEYCQNSKIPFHRDPSNDSDHFARVRMRKSMAALAKEGLTAQRLSVTAKRLRRAQRALDEMARDLLQNSILEKKTDVIVLQYSNFKNAPEEIALRALLRAMKALAPSEDYGPRLERVENLCADLMKPDPFRKRTLSCIIFERKDKSDSVILTREH